MNKLRISTKLIIGFLLIGLLSIVVIGSYSYYLAYTELETTINDKLRSVKEIKKQQIERFFKQCYADVNILSSSKTVTDIFNELGEYQELNQISIRDKFFTDDPAWQLIYRKHKKSLQYYIDLYDYSDVLLINVHGQITYSYLKNNNLGENLAEGRLQNTHLAIVWKKIIRTGQNHITDFETFASSSNIYAFVGAPYYDANRQLLGVVILQLPMERVNQIMQNNGSLGESGEIVLLGKDYLLRNNSRFSLKTTALRIKVNTNTAEKALRGLSGTEFDTDYRDIESIVSYSPLNIKGLHWAIISKMDKDEAFRSINNLKFNILIVSILIIIVILGVAFYLSRMLSGPITKIKEIINKLGKGIFPETNLKYTGRDEIAEMNSALNMLIDGLKNTARFAEQIGEGNLEAKFKRLSKDDVLGNALQQMQNSLIEAQNLEKKRIDEEKIRNWATQGYTLFTDIQRQYTGDLEKLADNIIKNLVDYLKANQGGLFIYNTENENNHYLELLASYAYNRKKYQTKTIKEGEGLVGTCAIEGQTIYLDEIPESYIEITSGLGDANPKYLLIVPLKHEEQLMGIAELASFHAFQPYQIEFVEKLGESLAATLSNSKINERTSKLLKESQEQAENMAAQEEEMRQNLEEMQATREEAARRESEMSSIIDAIDHTLLRGEIDTNGVITVVNQHFLNTLEYRLEEIHGKHFEMLINDDALNSFREMWKIVIQGNFQEKVEKYVSKFDKETWLLSSYTPVKDSEGNILKILFLANNITEQKDIEKKSKKQAVQLEKQQKEMHNNIEKMRLAQREVSRKETEMRGIVNAIDHSLIRCEYLPNGSIISASKKYLNITGFSYSEVKGKNIKTFVRPDQLEQFDKIWQNVCNGNNTERVVHSTTKSGEELWLLIAYTPIKNEENEVVKIVSLATDITKQKACEDQINEQLQQIQDTNNRLTDCIDSKKEIQKQYADKIKSLETENNYLQKDFEDKYVSENNTLKQQLQEVQNEIKEQKALANTLETKIKIYEKEKQIIDKEIDDKYNEWLDYIEK